MGAPVLAIPEPSHIRPEVTKSPSSGLSHVVEIGEKDRWSGGRLPTRSVFHASVRVTTPVRWRPVFPAPDRKPSGKRSGGADVVNACEADDFCVTPRQVQI